MVIHTCAQCSEILEKCQCTFTLHNEHVRAISSVRDMSNSRIVHLTSINAKKEYPEFECVLYKARDSPQLDELTLTSEECENVDLAGHPIFVEHDNEVGQVGVILDTKFNAPDLMIRGCVNTPNVRVREEIRHMLLSGEISELQNVVVSEKKIHHMLRSSELSDLFLTGISKLSLSV